MIRRFAALAVLLALALSTVAATRSSREHQEHVSALQRRIEEQRERAESLHRALHQKRAQLHQAAARVTDLQGQLDETNSAIASVNQTLRYLGSEQQETERRLHWYSIQLSAAQRSLELHDSMLRKRLVDIYEYGSPNYLSVLLAARSYTDFIESWDDLRLLIAANQRVVRARRQAAARVLNTEQHLETTQLALQDEEQQQAQARSQLGGLASERSNLVSLADRDRRRIASQVANIEEISAAQEAQLEDLIREREAEEATGRRAAGIAGPPIASNGRFSWPVTGPITSPFGWRSNPFGGAPDFHPGLDIGVSTGTTVTAAASGTVIMAQWYGGYGNYILIDNGNHYSTGYGHLSVIYVSVGQVVQRGQAIAASGSTGYSTGPHLHFEIRYNGKPIDPAPRLSH